MKKTVAWYMSRVLDAIRIYRILHSCCFSMFLTRLANAEIVSIEIQAILLYGQIKFDAYNFTGLWKTFPVCFGHGGCRGLIGKRDVRPWHARSYSTSHIRVAMQPFLEHISCSKYAHLCPARDAHVH